LMKLLAKCNKILPYLPSSSHHFHVPPTRGDRTARTLSHP
jgi:hypothetical protein